MPLKSIVDEFTAQLEADGVTAKVFFGGEHVYAQSAPPRIVWVPTSDTFEAPDQIGGNARAIRTCIAGLDAVIWGRTQEQAELLRDSVIAAVHAKAYGIYQITSGQWAEANEKMLTYGRGYRLALTLRLPVFEPANPTHAITDVDHEGELALPSSDVVEC